MRPLLVALPLLVTGVSTSPMTQATADRLPPCPPTPNCVSSLATGAAAMPAIPYVGDRAETARRLRAALAAQPRTAVVREERDRWHAEARSFLFRFVDDIDFLFDDAARVVHFRSASRVGRSDLGVNRNRMAAIARAVAEGGR